MEKDFNDLLEVFKAAAKVIAAKTEETAAMMTAMDATKEAVAKAKSKADKLLVRHYCVYMKELQ